MIGIIIGIAAVVSLIGIGEGLRTAIISQFDFLSPDILTVQGGGVQMGPPGSGVVNPLTEDNVNKIEKLKGVDLAIGRIIESTKVGYNSRIDFTYSGSMPDGEQRKEVERIAQLEIKKGRMLKDGDRDVVVLGNNFLKSDRFGKPVKLRDDVTVQGKEFKVIGFLEKKGNFIIDNAVTMNEDVMKNLFNRGEEYDMILVKIAKGFEISQAKAKVEEFLRDERDVEEGEEDFSVESSEQAVDSLNSTLFAVQIFFYVIAGISIIVGGIGISNTMYTSVLERTKDIGVMKSIGAKNKDIFTLFFIESGLLGTVGGILGIIVGLSIAYLLVFIGKLALGSELISLRISPFLILGALLFSFLIGTMAGVLPAYRASKMNPVDALRK
jgi:putative ABC transport system permease protein